MQTSFERIVDWLYGLMIFCGLLWFANAISKALCLWLWQE